MINQPPIDELAEKVGSKYGLCVITSKELGEMVMQGLKDLDEVAYVRFASVYRQFKDVSTFMKELEKLQNKETEK